MTKKDVRFQRAPLMLAGYGRMTGYGFNDFPFNILLKQTGPDCFKVHDGEQCHDQLNYEAAATKLGLAVMRALATAKEITIKGD